MTRRSRPRPVRRTGRQRRAMRRLSRAHRLGAGVLPARPAPGRGHVLPARARTPGRPGRPRTRQPTGGPAPPARPARSGRAPPARQPPPWPRAAAAAPYQPVPRAAFLPHAGTGQACLSYAGTGQAWQRCAPNDRSRCGHRSLPAVGAAARGAGALRSECLRVAPSGGWLMRTLDRLPVLASLAVFALPGVAAPRAGRGRNAVHGQAPERHWAGSLHLGGLSVHR